MSFDELSFHHRLNRLGTIVEVGANKGAMAAHFSSWERNRFLAFEPFPPIHDLLARNLTEGHSGSLPDRIELRREALGDRPGRATMRVPRTRAGLIDEWASLAKTFNGMEGVDVDEVEVPVTTLDAFGLDDVSAMKVDAEGFEQEVLLGSRQTIARCRPILSVELEERHRAGCTYFVPGFLAGLGYDGLWYDYRNNEFRPISAFDRSTMQRASASPAEEDYGEFYVFLFYFIPREIPDLRFRLSECAPIRER